MKVVINWCYGGFGLSDEAFKELIKLGMKVTTYNKQGNCVDSNAQIVENIEEKDYTIFGKYHFVSDDNEIRKNELLIKVVEKLGRRANNRFSDLKIVEIPDGVEWEIDEYDGLETIHEKHRSWG